MYALPWPDETFDAAMSVNGIWGGCEAALDEAFRVLRPGGLIGISFWGTGPPLDIRNIFRVFAIHAPQEHRGSMRQLNNIATVGVAEAMLTASGFAVLERGSRTSVRRVARCRDRLAGGIEPRARGAGPPGQRPVGAQARSARRAGAVPRRAGHLPHEKRPAVRDRAEIVTSFAALHVLRDQRGARIGGWPSRSSSTSTRCARTPTRRRSGSATCARQVGLDITWRFFSLEEVNRVEGKKHPWERPWSFGWGQMRVGSLIRRELGNDALDRWYAAVGTAFFNDGIKTHVPAVHAEVIAGERLRPDARRAGDRRPDHDRRRARRSRRRGRASTARTACRPSCSRSGYAVYGPVVVPAPTGDDAVALWELVRIDGTLPAPLRAAPPEDARRSRARRAELPDLPHDPRLEHGREPGAVAAVDATLSASVVGRRRRPATTRSSSPSTPATFDPPPSRAAARTDADGHHDRAVLGDERDARRPRARPRRPRRAPCRSWPPSGPSRRAPAPGTRRPRCAWRSPARSRCTTISSSRDRATADHPVVALELDARACCPALRPTGRTSASANRMPWPSRGDEQQLVVVPAGEHAHDPVVGGELHRDDAVLAARTPRRTRRAPCASRPRSRSRTRGSDAPRAAGRRAPRSPARRRRTGTGSAPR